MQECICYQGMGAQTSEKEEGVHVRKRLVPEPAFCCVDLGKDADKATPGHTE
jgi:hypothetical protein